MLFTNLTNIFTVFGNFAVFDEETIIDINEVYGDCNIAINQEPQNPNNKSGKVMQITNPKEHYQITLRPLRIDVQFPGADREKFSSKLLEDVKKVFTNLEKIFSGCLANRIAYVSNDFIFDDYAEKNNQVIRQIGFLDSTNDATEFNMRVNTPMTVNNERMNVVFVINNAMIGRNDSHEKSRPALVLVHDVNSDARESEQRFDLGDLDEYFLQMYNLVTAKVKKFEKTIL